MNDLQKKMTACLVMLAAIVVFFPIYWAREPARQEAAAARIKMETVQRGSDIYVAHCILCHGKTGGTIPGKNLNRTQIAPVLLIKVVGRGRPSTIMPAFAESEGGPLKDFEISDLAVFLGNWDQLLIDSNPHLKPVPTPVPTSAPTPKPSPVPATPSPAATPKPGPTPGPKGTGVASPTPAQSPTPAGTPAPSPVAADPQKGQAVYTSSLSCLACHGANAQGVIGPSLIGKSPESFSTSVRAGKGGMPAFSTSQLSDADLSNIIAYLATLK